MKSVRVMRRGAVLVALILGTLLPGAGVVQQTGYACVPLAPPPRLEVTGVAPVPG